ncbi:MAG: peptidoglycan-binding protein [Pseudomonadota bacterium]
MYTTFQQFRSRLSAFKSPLMLIFCALFAAGVMLTSATPPAQANKGLGAAAVGLAAGMVIGGAIANSQAKQRRARPKRQAKPRRAKPKKRTVRSKSKKRTVRSKSKKRVTTRRAKTRTSTRRSVATGPSINTTSEVYKVKSALASLGMLSGSVNDDRDAAYDASIKSYQASKKLAATGVLDDTQRQLLLREAGGRNELIALGSPNANFSGRDGAKRLQRALKILGHYNSGIDGKFGAGSRRAVAAYQAERGLPTTGDLTTPKAKGDLIRAARKSVETNMAAISTQFGQISRQQFAAVSGGSAATKPVSKPVAAAASPVSPTVSTGTTAAAVAAPAVTSGYLPQPTVQTAALTANQRTFEQIEPVRSDAAVRRPSDVAVIIGNRDYRGDIPDVSFGHRDADAVRSVLINELGFDKGNIIDARDAGQAELVSIFGSKSNNRGKVWRLIDPDGGSNVFVFYSGHGAPDTNSNTPYLMPVDSHPDTIQLNGYPLSQMYSNLEALEVQSVAVFLDACFSGGSAGGMLTKSASPVAVTAKMPVVQKSQKLTVLAAAEGDQLASWNEKAGFGMFTDYLVDGLKGAADQDGDKLITAGELHAFVHNKVRRMARREFGRIQTPVLMGKSDYVVRQK